MTTRAMGPGAGWTWLRRGVNLGASNPRAIFGGAALMMLVALVPTVLQLAVQGTMGADGAAAMGGLLAFSLLYSLLVMPPVMAGYLRLIHASETGAAPRAGAVFDVVRSPPDALRIIGLVLLLMVLGIVLFGAVIAGFGLDMLEQLATVAAASQSATPTLPQLPSGFGMLMALVMLLALFFNGVYAIAVGQVALSGRGVFAALGDGLVGTLKNLLPLLVAALIALVGGIVALLALMLVVALLAFIGGLVHPVLAIALAAPVYLLAMVALYVVMFGVMYFFWRDVCADPALADALPVRRDDQVEL